MYITILLTSIFTFIQNNKPYAVIVYLIQILYKSISLIFGSSSISSPVTRTNLIILPILVYNINV